LLRPGVSPHAPYTVSAAQLELISRRAIDQKLPLMMHAAESEAERLFMLEGTGPFADGLRSRGIDWQAPGISTVEYLARHGIFETKPLLAHCVTVDDVDIDLIIKADAGVAHCPKSNAKLGHGRAPFAKFIAAGVRVGLGSDSVASNNNCDLLEEARFATLLGRVGSANRGSSLTVREGSVTEPRADRGPHASIPRGVVDASGSDTQLDPTFRGGLLPAISAKDVLFAATLGGARALGLDDQIGALAEGMQADLISVGLEGAHQHPVSDPADALIFSSSRQDVRFTMVAGREIYRDGAVTVPDHDELISRLRKVRQRLDSINS